MPNWLIVFQLNSLLGLQQNKLCGKLRYMPPPLCTVQPSSTPYMAHACATQHNVVPVAVGAMNIHDVRIRQTTDIRQTSDSIIV